MLKFCNFLLALFVTTVEALDLDISGLHDFFNTTYIRRESAEWNPKTRDFAAKGYTPSWDVYSLHHVCIQKGQEGIFVGMKDKTNNWKEIMDDKTIKHYLVSDIEWNSLKHISDLKKNLMETYTAKRLDLSSQQIKKIIYLEKGTFFFNCEQNSLDIMAHGDWVVKHGVLYEISSFFNKNKGKSTFKYQWPSPFKTVFMNRCSDPEKADWNFGNPIMEIVKRRTDAYGLTKHGFTRYLRTTPDPASTDMVCFEDMYLSGRLSATLQGQDNLLEFRRDTAVILGEPNEVLSDPEEEVNITPGYVQQMYCKSRDFRIKILQLDGEPANRRFMNMDDVVSVLQRFSTIPVEILVISRKMPLPEIIDYFNSFDILVSPVGSHLIHGLFTAFPFTKAVIEVSPFLKDPYFHRVFSRHFLFAEYVVSTGHLSRGLENVCPFQNYRHYDKANCSINPHSYFKRWRQERMICPHVFSSALDCDIEVNITTLAKHMGMLVFQSLCKPGMPLADNMTATAHSELARAKYNDTVLKERSFKGINSLVSEVKKHMIPNPPKTALPPDLRYPKSKHYTYGYYRVLDRALNISNVGHYKTEPFKYYLSIIAMFKNEAGIMKEWLEHHIGHGVEHLYLVDDYSTDNAKTILEPYLKSGKVSLHSPPSVHIPFRQAALYKKLFTEIYSKNESKWVAIIDLDEFLYSPLEIDIKKILRKHEDLSVVGLNWVWFGSNGYVKQPNLVIQSFNTRADFNVAKYPELINHYRVLSNRDDWQKNIINTAARIDNVDVHQVVAEGISASLGYSAFPENPELLLNHYSTQSRDFFLLNKGTRGDVNNWIEITARNMQWFNVCDINDVVDNRLQVQNLQAGIAINL